MHKTYYSFRKSNAVLQHVLPSAVKCVSRDVAVRRASSSNGASPGKNMYYLLTTNQRFLSRCVSRCSEKRLRRSCKNKKKNKNKISCVQVSIGSGQSTAGWYRTCITSRTTTRRGRGTRPRTKTRTRTRRSWLELLLS